MQRAAGLVSLVARASRRRGTASPRRLQLAALASVLSSDAYPPRSAYVHIPFCRRRCFYCDFPILVVGDNTRGAAVSAAMDDYVTAVCADIAASASRAGSTPQQLHTVFFGGGTPSLLPAPQLGRILDALRRAFGVAPGAEVSMELDPGSFDEASLAAYLALGVTRVNLGVQSFDAAMLKGCGRAHSVSDVAAAVAAVRASGVASWGLDLISGLPLLRRDTWAATLRSALQAAPHHVSVYDLQVEAGTAFGRWYTPGAAPLPPEADTADMLRDAHEQLTAAGFEHYEVSNFARPGHRCAHNMAYWRNHEWHAFGVAAASHLGGRRFTRPRRLRDYLAWVAAGATVPPAEPEARDERLLDTLMLGLRLADGVDMRALRSAFGDAAADTVVAALAEHAPALATLRGAGGAALDPAHAAARPADVTAAQLTAPDGFLLSNSVLAAVFARL